MLRLELSFPGGRYHATPWATHVNEGQVEWPPSPWRLVRALIAVGFTRLEWTEVPAAGRTLLEKLASVLPAYALPENALGHARHYMPIRGKTTKVFDAFAYVGAGSIGIEYDVQATTEERELLAALLERLPYLGRAESWVLASLDESTRGSPINCRPLLVESADGAPLIEVLAPETVEQFSYWRTRALEEAWSHKLAQKADEAAKKGKLAPSTLTKVEQAKIASTLPESLIHALQVETGALQKGGWSMPPGSRWVRYLHDEAPERRVVMRRAHANADITTALLALSSDTRRVDVLPPFRDALRRMELLHRSLVSLSDPTHQGHGSPVFTGQNENGSLRGHRHATLLPLTLGRRADRLDHVLVHAPMGLDAAARQALGALRKTYAPGMPDVFVTLAGLGRIEDFATLVPEAATATVWRSTTPFVPPRHPKRSGANTLEAMVQRELEERGLARASRIEIELTDGAFVPLLAWQAADTATAQPTTRFRLFRRERENRPPPVRIALGLKLHFDAPQSGPISLGYGSHFGLGAFRPA